MARIKKLPKFVKLIKPEKVVKAKFDVKAFAEMAAKAAALPDELGQYKSHIEEGEGITTYFWQSKKLGYGDWRWAVTVYQQDPATEPSLCEVVMVPGDDALIAPNWVPWAERLADYQALQIELEKQAALDAAEAAVETEPEEELAVTDLEEGEDAKD